MRILLRYLRPFQKDCLLVALTMVMDVASALLVPTITANMINLAVGGGAIAQIVWQGLLMLGVSLVSGAATLWGSWLCAHISADLGRDLRNAVYDRSLAFSDADFERFGTASMITRTLNDINILQQAFVAFVQMVLPVPVMCVLGIFMAFRLSPMMGRLLLCVTVLVVLAALLIVRRAAPIFERLQGFLDRMNVVLRENLTGVRVIRAFRKEKSETGRMKKTFLDYAESSIRANRLFAGLDCLAMVVINLCVVAVLYLGGNQVGKGTMEIGDITAVTEYAIWILFYVVMAQMVVMLVPRAMICARRVSAVLTCQPEIADGPEAALEAGGEEVISFRDVRFRFEGADEDALSGLDFSCLRGRTTAVVGGTGSGKSTLAKLLLRYHDVSGGRVTLAGRDIREMPQETLRGRISYVPQKAWLFSGTIAENIRYGAPEASDEDIWHALEVAQADFVKTFPEGLNAPVSQGGTNFSGGQRQRLAIARALAKKADLYVFDDSFSALDFKTDAALRRAIGRELTDAAVLIIAQRISTILHADQILVLSNGKLVGKGTHGELMETCPVYRDIAESQMKGGGFHG